MHIGQVFQVGNFDYGYIQDDVLLDLGFYVGEERGQYYK